MFHEKLQNIPGVEVRFQSPSFHECVLQLQTSADAVLERLAAYRIQGGLSLHEYYPELKNCVLVCVTETKTASDLDYYVQHLEKSLAGALGENHPSASGNFSFLTEPVSLVLSQG